MAVRFRFVLISPDAPDPGNVARLERLLPGLAASADALVLRCWVDDELMQESTTANLIYSVPELIEAISRYCVLRPGDLIFTGTPAGVGSTREPRRYLAAGELIRSEIEGIGKLSNRCVDPG